MKVSHQHSKGCISRRFDSLEDKAIFLRPNNDGDFGGYAYWFPVRQTRYEGWYVNGKAYNQPFLKLIDRFEFSDLNDQELSVAGITIKPDHVVWELNNNTQVALKLIENHEALTVVASSPIKLKIWLDIRGTYMQPDANRNYIIEQNKSGYSIKYSDPFLEKDAFLEIKGDGTEPISEAWNHWQEQYSPRDEIRNSPPYHLYTMCLGQLTGQKFDFGYGISASESHKTVKAANETVIHLDPQSLDVNQEDRGHDIEIAKSLVEKGLKWLKTNHGYYAGLPWFHQVWTRDELLTALGLSEKEQLRMIERYLGADIRDGEMPTFIGSGTYCADGLAWFCLLIREYGLDKLSEKSKNHLEILLQRILLQLHKKRISPLGLVYSGWNATWMDTIGREGYCIDTQCGLSLALEMLHTLTKKEIFHREKVKLVGKIRQNYWTGTHLCDRLNDPTKRPNVFLTYLLQPDLLPKERWITCFETVLKACKNPWGGLSSIDREHTLFQPGSTGQDNRSYHNGDSWFFVNNLAAVALYRLDKIRFAQTIRDLVSSSTDEVLWEHKLGYPGEIASSEKLESYGCGLQGFSGGGYLFMIEQLDLLKKTE